MTTEKAFTALVFHILLTLHGCLMTKVTIHILFIVCFFSSLVICILLLFGFPPVRLWVLWRCARVLLMHVRASVYTIDWVTAVATTLGLRRASDFALGVVSFGKTQQLTAAFRGACCKLSKTGKKFVISVFFLWYGVFSRESCRCLVLWVVFAKLKDGSGAQNLAGAQNRKMLALLLDFSGSSFDQRNGQMEMLMTQTFAIKCC